MVIMTHDMAAGERALDKLLANMKDPCIDLNEADTRHRFLDLLIHDVLAWERSDTHLEKHADGEYSDYELGEPPQILIEAKKSGVTFDLPHEGSSRLLRSIKSISSNSQNFKKAFEQVVKYCANRSIQVGVIANSTQIIVFIGVRADGVPVIDGKCLAFCGYESIKQNFAKLWQALSPDAAGRHALLEDLRSGSALTGIPAKLSSRIPDYPSFRYPSGSQQSLRVLSDLLIEDAPNTPEFRKSFLEKCYCESGALAQEALLGKNILAARYAAMFAPTEQSPTMQPIKPSLENRFGLPPEAIADAFGRRPIVIIGDVGVGKTSFIRNLIYVKAEEEMKDTIFIYIDLGSQANLGQNIQDFLLGDIKRQLLEDYSVDIDENSFVRGVYYGDLIRFEKGIYGSLKEKSPEKFLEKQIERLSELTKDTTHHLQKSIEHISKGRKKHVVICIDNADQREYDDQQRAFLAAQEFSSSWHALVLVSIRPRTYFASKASGSISAYPQRILTISPPRIDKVLERRLTYSLDLAEGRLPLEHEFTINLNSIALFLKALIYSLENNKELRELLVNITGGNIREALELIKKFIGSANVDSEKIIRAMEIGNSSYVIPLHEFSKAALLGEYSHYDSRSSIACNLFDLRYPDPREHFLCLILVSYLLSDTTSKDRDGFIKAIDIIAEMQKIGYVSEQIEQALRRLTNKKLIEGTERITFDEGLQGLMGDMPLAFRATTIGSYHVTRWVPTFAYMDAMLFDTPILDNDVRTDLVSKISSFEISERLRRTTIFRKYLDRSWDEISNPPLYFSWDNLRQLGEASFNSVQKFVASRTQRTS
ncbi:MAG: AAA family ATPase [Zoogloeaceae bacterium]|jgi:GTPase SAR1 family protein|nr:AAA family ATPase [Zoogloeaceae bacterium]